MQGYEADRDLASIKLVATDMDLTLLMDDKAMPEGIYERIEALDDLGVTFCAASGRPAPSLRTLFERDAHRMAFIADNGAAVYQGSNPVYRDLMDPDRYRRVLMRCTELNHGVPVLCAFGEAYALSRDYAHRDTLSLYYQVINFIDSFEGLDVEANKMSIYYPDWDSPQALQEVYEPEFGKELYLTTAGSEWLDFMNIGIDKGSGIRHLCERMGIDLKDVAAFGDTYNDIPMLEAVGHGYVMGNAAEHMHAHGDFLAPRNSEQGVLTVIDRIIEAKRA